MPRKKVVTEEITQETPLEEESAASVPAPKPRTRRPRAPKQTTQTASAPVRVVERRSSNVPVIVGVTMLVTTIVVGGAVMLGSSDRGEIDVNAAIIRSNEANMAAGGDAANYVPVESEALRDMPNGGLVAQENQPAPEPPPTETASTTASSTDQTATTTSSTPETTEPAADPAPAENTSGEVTPS